MRIAVIYYQDFRTPHAGGVLNYVRAVVRNARPGDEFVYWGREMPGAIATSPYGNTRLRRVCLAGPRGVVPEGLRFAWNVWRHRSEIERDADLVMVHTNESALPWALPGRGCQPLVWVQHMNRQHEESWLPFYKVHPYRLIDAVAAMACDLIVHVSSENMRFFGNRHRRAAGKGELHGTFADDSIIPSESREAIRARLNVSERQVLGYVGRFDYPKQIDRMIEAFESASRLLPAGLFVMAGEGPMLDDARKRAASLGIGDRVRFPGVLSREDVGELLSASDATILLSSHEGMPLGVLESLACGTPVIVSDVAGIGEVLRDGVSGSQVSAGDSVADIGRSIARVIESGESMRAAALEDGRRHLASVRVPLLLDRLEELVSRR